MPGGAPAGWAVEKKIGAPSLKTEKDGENYSIEEQRLIVKGAGPSQPVADNSTPEGQKQNRRVLIRDCPE